MLRLTTLNRMKKGLTAVVFITALFAMAGFQSRGAAAQAAPTWSVVVHFQYADGLEYDYVLATGVSASEMPAMLEECGRSHRSGSVVRYHCYAVPE